MICEPLEGGVHNSGNQRSSDNQCIVSRNHRQKCTGFIIFQPYSFFSFMCMVLISDMVDIKTCNPHTQRLFNLRLSGPEISDSEKAALVHAGPPCHSALRDSEELSPPRAPSISAAAVC